MMTSTRNLIYQCYHEKGGKTFKIMNAMKIYVNNVLPGNIRIKTADTEKRLSNSFKTENKTRLKKHISY